MHCSLEQIANRIKAAKKVAIFTHMRPDGDAYGSAFALSCALDTLGIENCVCVESDVPSNLAFIKGLENAKKQPPTDCDLIVTVDCSDEQRLGALSDAFLTAVRKKIDTINVDHHVSNTRFAKWNYVRECSANCMNVATLIEYLGAPIDKKTAEYLFVGLLTDSGAFSHDDVTEEVFLLAAKCATAGVDVRYYQYNLFKKQTKQRAALFAKTMGKMRYYFDGRFAVIVITRQALEECGADQSMTEGFVDFPLNVDTVEIAAAVLEMKKGQYNISLRSKTYADVNKIASTYGGGGHVRASGCMLFGEMEEVLDKLSYTVSQYLE